MKTGIKKGVCNTILVCVLTLTSLFAQTLSVDAKSLGAGVSPNFDIIMSEKDLKLATSTDIYAPTATNEVYTIIDAVVSAERSAEDTISFTLSNEGFATIKEWSISFEADYNIVASERVEVLDNSNVKTIVPMNTVSLAAGDFYEFELTVATDTEIDTNVEYRVYGVYDDSLSQCDEEYIDSLLTSSDFVEYDCKTGEEKLATVDLEDVGELDSVSSHASSVVGEVYETGFGGVDTYAIIGSDNRKRVTSVKKDPYYKIAYLYIIDANGNPYAGTGFLISKNYMLTAAHNVHISGKPVKSVTAYFGANGNNYGVKAYSSVVGWCSSYPSNQSVANDWGYIKLSSNAGNTCGWFGIGYTTKANLEAAKFTVCGYPADKAAYNKKSKMHGQNVQMWKHSGKLTKVQTGSLKYKMDAEIGQSGSPVYNSSTKIVYGIHYGKPVLSSTNSGARITKGIFTYLIDIGACK